jgi:hypothetical protein
VEKAAVEKVAATEAVHEAAEAVHEAAEAVHEAAETMEAVQEAAEAMAVARLASCRSILGRSAFLECLWSRRVRQRAAGRSFATNLPGACVPPRSCTRTALRLEHRRLHPPRSCCSVVVAAWCAQALGAWTA